MYSKRRLFGKHCNSPCLASLILDPSEPLNITGHQSHRGDYMDKWIYGILISPLDRCIIKHYQCVDFPYC